MSTSIETPTNLEAHLETLREAFDKRRRDSGLQPTGWLLSDSDGSAAHQLLASFEDHVNQEGGVVVTGVWRENLLRPFGGLLDLANNLATWVFSAQPELLGRYSLSLVNMLPAWRRAEPLRKTSELRSGLADFILHADRAGLKHFYWRRNVAPWMAADLIHFTLNAVEVIAEKTGTPVVLYFENIHLADALTLEALRLLNSYAQSVPVVICASSREVSGQNLIQHVGPNAPPSWQVLRLEEASRERDEADAPLEERFNSEQMELLHAASVLTLPFRCSDLLPLLSGPSRPAAPELLQDLVKVRALRRVGDDSFAMSFVKLREDIHRSLNSTQRRQLHIAALTVEAGDPFAATWHALTAELPSELKEFALQALERAWAVSGFDCALALARQYLATTTEESELDGDLLQALLQYDAGRFNETDQHLLAALGKPSTDGVSQITLKRLLGYNAIFGLNEFNRGREYLEEVLKEYEERGLEQRAHSGFVRNSIAFALFRVGRFDDAIETEKLGLELLESSASPNGFLFSILQLNLGRLYRNLGFSEQAIDRFKKALETQNSEFSPYMLLIFHCTLAHLHAAREEYAEVLDSYYHCLDLARDLELENSGYPVLQLLSQPIGPLLSGRVTRGDEVFFYLYLNLALNCRRLGLREREEAYLSGMRSLWSFLGDDIWQAVEAALIKVEPEVAGHKQAAPEEFERQVEEVRHRYVELVHEVDGTENLVSKVAGALADKKAVAIVRPREIGPGLHLIDSLVLYDPREATLSKRINAEVGVSSGFYPPSFGYSSPAARTALVLPEAADQFSGLKSLPLVLQEVTLKSAYREDLPALNPYHIRLQMLFPEFDGILYEILKEFAERTGVGVLATVPFHLRRRILCLSPEKSLNSFLISPVDCLLLGNGLLTKSYGATAGENLLPFRPRLSHQASLVDDKNDAFLVLIRTWAYHHCIKLRGEMRPILDLCDGNRSVADVMRSLEGGFSASPEGQRDVCGFFRKLWRHGALSFDEPVFYGQDGTEGYREKLEHY